MAVVVRDSLGMQPPHKIVAYLLVSQLCMASAFNPLDDESNLPPVFGNVAEKPGRDPKTLEPLIGVALVLHLGNLVFCVGKLDDDSAVECIGLCGHVKIVLTNGGWVIVESQSPVIELIRMPCALDLLQVLRELRCQMDEICPWVSAQDSPVPVTGDDWRKRLGVRRVQVGILRDLDVSDFAVAEKIAVDVGSVRHHVAVEEFGLVGHVVSLHALDRG